MSKPRLSTLCAVVLLTFVSMAQACKVAPSSAARLAAWVEQSRLGSRARPNAHRDIGASVFEARHFRPLAPSSAPWSGLKAFELQDNEGPEIAATPHANPIANIGLHCAVALRSTSATGHVVDVTYAPQFLVASILATGPPSNHS